MTGDITSVVSIQYDEFGGADSYRGVAVSTGYPLKYEEKIVFSGDVVADFAAAIELASSLGERVMYSSTCDHFVTDTKEFAWSRDELLVRKG